jgi:hypothetical protein
MKSPGIWLDDFTGRLLPWGIETQMTFAFPLPFSSASGAPFIGLADAASPGFDPFSIDVPPRLNIKATWYPARVIYLFWRDFSI